MNDRNVNWIFIASLILGLSGIKPASAQPITREPCRNIVVDKIWSGSPVGATAISTPTAIFAAYYNADRYMTVAKIDVSSCEVIKHQLDSRFMGYDTHNYIAMTLDANEVLHVSGNMHGSPLVYYHARYPLDISTLEPSKMSGLNEHQVTYPVFFSIDSKLHFLYREGISGDGASFVNAYSADLPSQTTNGSGWSKVFNGPLTVDKTSFNGKLSTDNAYWTRVQQTPDGFFHFAITWRIGSPDEALDSVVTYVRTKDFLHWQDASGTALTLPLSPDKVMPVIAPGPNKGLGAVKLSFTASGQPIILYSLYLKTDNGLRNGLYAARFDAVKNSWSSILLTQSNAYHAIGREGSLETLPHVSELSLYGSVALLSVIFGPEPRQYLKLDSVTLMPTTQQPKYSPDTP
jgi:hypothetical protein